MKIGTKSLLFGVHQFLWHPYVVGRAWRELYGRSPDRYEWVAIITHDLGYWGLGDMDGPEGIRHPARSMKLAQFVAKWVCRATWWNAFKKASKGMVLHRMVTTGILVRHHSRSMTEIDNQNPCFATFECPFRPSRLCWPDKFSVLFEPEWFYLLRARLTGELDEFRDNAVKGGYLPASASGKDWFRWYRARVCNMPEIRALLNT